MSFCVDSPSYSGGRGGLETRVHMSLPDWKVDGWVRCPACETWSDAAGVFGDVEGEDIGLQDGTTGTCDCCGAKLVVRLEVAGS
jgi:hypothetical protein